MMLTASCRDDNTGRSNSGSNIINGPLRPRPSCSEGHGYNVMFVAMCLEESRDDDVVGSGACTAKDLTVEAVSMS